MNSVCVLMSTYNGEKYIRQQIDSILNQKMVNVSLIIRDDGSSDKTIEIIDEFIKNDKRVKLYCGDNVGACESFLNLIWNVGLDYDYYALSDQDDYWMDNKIISAIESINNCNKEKRVYCSNVIVTDAELNPLHNRILEKKYEYSFGNSLLESKVTGCTVVMEKSFMVLLRQKKKPEKQYIHDWWIYKMATCYGTLIYDVNAYMYYRQHDNNTIGLSNGIIGRIKRFINNAGKIKSYVKEQNREFEEIYDLTDEAKYLVNIINHHKFKLMMDKRIRRTSSFENIIYKMWMMFW